jgi:polar amino acid transport system substrate-binding protein
MTFRRLALAALLAAAGTARAGEAITIVADSYCPFNCEPGSASPGYVVELAEKIFAAKGIAVKYEVVSWDDAVAAARKGQYAAIIGAYKQDAPDFIFPAATIARAGSVYIVRKGDPWRFTGTASLAGRKFGLIKDYSYGELDAWFKAHPEATVRVEGADPLDLNLKNLLTKKVDVVIEEASVFQFKAGQRKLGDLVERVGEAEPAKDMYLAFSPAAAKSKEYAKLFSDGLEALRKSGELAAILKKYGVKDWK